MGSFFLLYFNEIKNTENEVVLDNFFYLFNDNKMSGALKTSTAKLVYIEHFMYFMCFMWQSITPKSTYL